MNHLRSGLYMVHRGVTAPSTVSCYYWNKTVHHVNQGTWGYSRGLWSACPRVCTQYGAGGAFDAALSVGWLDGTFHIDKYNISCGSTILYFCSAIHWYTIQFHLSQNDPEHKTAIYCRQLLCDLCVQIHTTRTLFKILADALQRLG
jgi:hypothetical protein